MQQIALHRRAVLREGGRRPVREFSAPRRGHVPSAVPGDHRDHAIQEVAEVVREIRRVAAVELLDEGLRRGVVAVAVPGHLPQQEVPERVRPVPFDEFDEAEFRSRRLRELGPADLDEAVAPHALRRLHARREQHRRPVHAVEAGDVLADDVEVRGPELPERLAVRIADRRDVVRQRVEPHVDRMPLIPREGDAPADPGAGGRDVVESGFQQTHDFVAPRPGPHGGRVVPQAFEEGVPVVGELEEPVLLLRPLDLAPGVERAAPVLEFLVLLEGFAPGAVVALVLRAAEVPVLGDPLHERGHAAVVARFRGPDEVVVRQPQAAPDVQERLGDPVDPFRGGRSLLLRLLLDLLPVLVHPDEKVDVVPAGAPVPGDHVGADLLDRVSQVRVAVRVVDRRREIEPGH